MNVLNCLTQRLAQILKLYISELSDFMDKEHIKYGIRCSLENFGEFVNPKGKRTIVNPLYAISNLF